MPLLAQDRTIRGQVTDENGQPIPSVSVMVKGTKVGTVTDKDGNYTITVPANGRTLVFSAAEQGSRERNIGTSSTVNVSLSGGDKSMEEVVVVGYQVRKKREEGGAVSQIRGAAIQNLPNVSVDRALQGRAAGVLVQASNGIPGGAINVRVRGTGSILSGTQPLYIVDGVQINMSQNSSFTQTNPLAFLNPNDIESIDVLKDAASAAIYGSQASNGVVIVTTKRGRAGKTRFNFNAYAGVSERLRTIPNLSTADWVQARAEADFNRWQPLSFLPDNNIVPGGLPYTFLNSRQWALGELANATGIPFAVTSTFNDKQIDSVIATLPNTNWQDESMRRGTIQNYDLSMEGGNEKTTFYLGANYTYQSTIFDKVDFKRYGLNTSINHKATDRLNVGLKLNISSFDQQVPFATDGSFLGNPAFAAATILNVNPVRNTDGTYFGLPPAQALAGALNQNIIAVNQYNTGNQRTNAFVGALNLDYKILNWLTFRSFASMDYRTVQGARFRDPRTNDGFNVRGRATTEVNWSTNFLTTQTLNFSKNFGQVSLDGLVGYEYRRENTEATNGESIGFPTPDFRTADAGATPVFVGQSWTGWRRSSGFVRVNAGYKQRYLLSVLGRRDGSSRFGSDNPFGNYYGIIGTWVMDREKFMKKLDWVSQLRMRLSFGQTGNDQIGNFAGRGLFSGSGIQYNGFAGTLYSQLPNPGLSWETNQTLNFGIDFGLFRNRISGSVEVYDRTTKDMLLPQQVGFVNGVASFTNNVGELNIKGVEVTLNGDVIRPTRNDGFRWNAGVTFSFAYNKVTRLFDGQQILPGDPSIRVGRSLGSVFTQVYEGVNPATGRPMFRDTFGMITYQPQLRDRRYIGDTEPDYWGGMTQTVSFKGFTLDALFTYEFGRLATDGQINFMIENGNRLINGWQTAFDKRWRRPGDITSYPRIFDTGVEPGGVNHASGSSRLWRKADFIRLRDVRLSYDLPNSLMRRVRLSSARIYVQGQNLWTISDWWGYDPEFVGTSTGIIPQTRNYNVGIQLGF